MTTALTTLHDVTAGYGGCAVLHAVSLEVKAGEAWAVLGPNGAGKTTLAKVAAGLLGVLQGRVTVGGLPSSAAPAALAKVVAWVPQQAPEGLDFTALEVALMGRAPHLGPLGLTGAHDEQLAREALAAFDVAPLADRAVSSLSGGERRRVFLARALTQAAPLLVLDEPTAFLDVRHQVDTLHLVRQRISPSVGVLAVLHDVSLAAHFATHVALMSAGRLVAQGPAAEVLTTARLSEVYGIAMEQTGEHSFQPRWPR
ncbi:MAG: ABC transporter ATP-binding protein [Myxococcales bacterium]|nr:ABC transporter ATP-binding protein [Myxococcales bacterium]